MPPNTTTCAAQEHQDVYMTRHSARIDKESRRWTPLPGRSRDDAHLSPAGEKASNELAARFRSIHLAHIVSSPFLRCLQTVAPIAKDKGLEIKVEPGICEVLNAHYPAGFWDADRLADKANLPVDVGYEPVMPREELRREWGDGDAAQRAEQVAFAVRERLEGPILFCGHGASCLGIAEAFGAGAHGYVGYSSFSHFRPFSDGSGGGEQWKVVEFGDVSHLSEELQRKSLASAW